MQFLVILVIIILAEKFTGKKALELVIWILKGVLALFSGAIEFLAGMREPRGSKS